ncbi:unnamed protein product, partial [Mesorhabditis belari]|uniref:Uncharacterized protein n=1 Tax=Mesorhabditis belari TaxID=2138241 RepID=A0AAF3EBH6_9BILA
MSLPADNIQKPRLQRQNGTSNLKLGGQMKGVLKETACASKIGLHGIAFKAQTKPTFEVFMDSPMEDENMDTNIIHQLEKQAENLKKAKDKKQLRDVANQQLKAKTEHSIAPSVPTAPIYEGALSTVFESLPQRSLRSVPMEDESMNTNIIHQLEKRAEDLKKATSKKELKDIANHQIRTKTEHSIAPSVSTASIYEDALSTVFESLPQRSPRPVLDEMELDDIELPTQKSAAENFEHAFELLFESDFEADIYQYMRRREVLLRPSPNYFPTQTEITPANRFTLVEWMSDVCADYNLNLETLALSVAIIDRMLSRKVVPKRSYQLVGAAALMIACKMEEIYFPEVKDFVFSTADACTGRDMIKMERYLMNTLQFDVSLPTCSWFSSRLGFFCNLSHRTSALVSYLIELSLVESDFLEQFPSIIGAAVVHTARVIADHVDFNDDEVSRRALLQHGQIVPVCHMLIKAFKKAPSELKDSIYEKYMEPSNHAVAAIECPHSLLHIN